jgi:small-conductance mechanosensitive channel
MQAPGPLQTDIGEMWDLLAGLSTLEARLVATAVVLLLVTITTRYVLPVVVRQAGVFVERRMPEGRLRSIGERVGHYFPSDLPGVSLRLLQTATVLVAGLGIIVVWDQVARTQQLLVSAGVTPRRFTQLLLTATLFAGAYICASAFRELVAQYSDGADQVTDHQEEIIVRVGNVAILVLAITSMLTLWGVNLSGLLVGAGFLGIVVGMAARQTLGSLIAGFVLMFARPFTIGDWVEIGNHEGIVTNITIMNTRMKNFDGEAIILPNDRVSNEPITNRSTQGHLRLRVDVGVDYETDPERAEQVALEAIREAAPVADAPPPQVIPKQFGDSAVVLELRFWIDRPTPARKWRAVSEVVSGVKRAFEAEGIKIPFPQRELSDRPSAGGISVHGQRDGEEVEPSPDD